MRRTLVTRFTKVSKSGANIAFEVQLLCGLYWVRANGMLIATVPTVFAAQSKIRDYAEAV